MFHQSSMVIRQLQNRSKCCLIRISRGKHFHHGSDLSWFTLWTNGHEFNPRRCCYSSHGTKNKSKVAAWQEEEEEEETKRREFLFLEQSLHGFTPQICVVFHSNQRLSVIAIPMALHWGLDVFSSVVSHENDTENWNYGSACCWDLGTARRTCN